MWEIVVATIISGLVLVFVAATMMYEIENHKTHIEIVRALDRLEYKIEQYQAAINGQTPGTPPSIPPTL